MKSIPRKKLSLSRTTVRVLSGDQLRGAVGAAMVPPSDSCNISECCWPPPGPTNYPPCVPQSAVCAPASTVLICV